MTYNNVFKISLYVLVVQLMPTRLRKPKHEAWLKLLAWPFQKILDQLNAYRTIKLKELSYNYQVGSIEKLLNDTFDSVERRIRLTEGVYIVPATIYTPTENKPLEMPFVIYTPEELASGNGDFIVQVPSALNLSDGDMIRLNALTRYYCLDDKAFKIEIV